MNKIKIVNTSAFYHKPIDIHAESKKSGSITAGRIKADSFLPGLDEIPLGFESFLPFAAKELNLSTDIKDYSLWPVIMMTSDLPNRNGVAFPLKELVKWNTVRGAQAYKTWQSMPLCHEHCFVAGTQVTTKNGFKNIEDITLEDTVWTHAGNWKKVVRLYKHESTTVKILATNTPGGIESTTNHPFYVVDKRQVYGRPVLPMDKERIKTEQMARNNGRFRIGNRGNYLLNNNPDTVTPHFRPLSDVYPGDYLVTKTQYGAGTVDLGRDLAFLLGVYAAEGSFSWRRLADKTRADHPSTVTLTLGFHETEFIEVTLAAAKAIGLNPILDLKRENLGVAIIMIHNVEFAKKCHHYVGEYSYGKRLDASTHDWNLETVLSFLGGYISGDGCTTAGDRSVLRIVTISKFLAYDVQNMLIAANVASRIQVKNHAPGRKAFGRIVKVNRPRYTTICRSKDASTLNEYIVGKKKLEVCSDYATARTGLVHVVDGLLLSPIISKTETGEIKTVYNFEVEDDNSYTVENKLVHNCNLIAEKKDPAFGIIADVHLSQLKGYSHNKLWKVVAMMALDRTKDPKMTARILSGELNSTSMGAYTDYYSCGYCGAEFGKCDHLDTRASHDFYELPEEDGTKSLVFRNVHGISAIEQSFVGDPAYRVALFDSANPFNYTD